MAAYPDFLDALVVEEDLAVFLLEFEESIECLDDCLVFALLILFFLAKSWIQICCVQDDLRVHWERQLLHLLVFCVEVG